MDMPFEIKFDFPLDHSCYTIALKAKVKLHPSKTYYIVDSFFFATTEQSGSFRINNFDP